MATARLTDETYRAAEDAVARRAANRTFTSVRAVLSWYFEARERLQAPNPRHPHTEPAPYRADLGERRSDTRVLVQVDGGKGSEMDDVYAVLLDIQRALIRAGRDFPRGAEALVTLCTTTVTQGGLAERHRLSPQQLSVEIGRAEAFLKGAFSQAEILR